MTDISTNVDRPRETRAIEQTEKPTPSQQHEAQQATVNAKQPVDASTQRGAREMRQGEENSARERQVGGGGSGGNVVKRGLDSATQKPSATTPAQKPTEKPSSSSLQTNQRDAYNAAIKEGLNPTAAKALVANMTGESLHKPTDKHWDVKHDSQGIVQWDPQRSAAIKKQFGKEPREMSVAEQTKAAVWEMKNKYPKTWQALQGNDPQKMMTSLVKDYERPANPDKEIAKRMAIFERLQLS